MEPSRVTEGMFPSKATLTWPSDWVEIFVLCVANRVFPRCVFNPDNASLKDDRNLEIEDRNRFLTYFPGIRRTIAWIRCVFNPDNASLKDDRNLGIEDRTDFICYFPLIRRTITTADFSDFDKARVLWHLCEVCLQGKDQVCARFRPGCNPEETPEEERKTMVKFIDGVEFREISEYIRGPLNCTRRSYGHWRKTRHGIQDIFSWQNKSHMIEVVKDFGEVPFSLSQKTVMITRIVAPEFDDSALDSTTKHEMPNLSFPEDLFEILNNCIKDGKFRTNRVVKDSGENSISKKNISIIKRPEPKDSDDSSDDDDDDPRGTPQMPNYPLQSLDSKIILKSCIANGKMPSCQIFPDSINTSIDCSHRNFLIKNFRQISSAIRDTEVSNSAKSRHLINLCEVCLDGKMYTAFKWGPGSEPEELSDKESLHLCNKLAKMDYIEISTLVYGNLSCTRYANRKKNNGQGRTHHKYAWTDEGFSIEVLVRKTTTGSFQLVIFKV